jgi:hypothetical protein
VSELEENRKKDAARYQTEIEALSLSPKSDAAAKAKPISKYEGNEDLAATKIQASFKGHQVRKTNKESKENKAKVEQPVIQITEDETYACCVTMVDPIYSTQLKSAKPSMKEDPEEVKAAVAIQKVYKGKKAREDTKMKKMDEKKFKAVVLIQKVFRGFKVTHKCDMVNNTNKTRKELKKKNILPIKKSPSSPVQKGTVNSPSELQKLIVGEISPRSRFGLGGFLGRPDYSKMVVESEPQFVLA